jgi:hypothetical protein
MKKLAGVMLIVVAGVFVATALAGTRAKPAVAAPPISRYSVANGCYSLGTPSGHLGPFRMQATALGQYLVYGGPNAFLGPGLKVGAGPSNSTVWLLNGHFTITNLATHERVPVTFTPASGCATYPEASVDATGKPFVGASPESQVSGTIDAHTHVTAFEFLGGDWHCGRPWHPFGIPFALPDCAPYEQGTNGLVESFIDYGTPSHPHDTRGWPTFAAWPSPTDLAEEGDYYTGIKRAWMAGLRVMVTQLVDNEALCALMTSRRNPCNDMQAVELQARDLRALQNYIDAQSGGPGKGFFRIVTNPFQARQAINQGKLAVVEGIEVSHLFNCGETLGVPDCSPQKIDAGLAEVKKLGVSTFFPIHKFDNAFGGTKMDSGELGVLVNLGQHLETGQFWDVQTCTGPEHDSTQLTSLPTGGLTTLLHGKVGRALGLPIPLPIGGTVPAYPPPPHCNVRGLTSLGAYLINQMIRQHFIVELDHMDAKSADSTLSILEQHHYSGVISAHSWDSPEQNPRIYKLGGFMTPIAGASPGSFVSQWQASRRVRDKRFLSGLGFGYGADMNGLAEESQPTAAHPITYPFKSFDGRVSFTREQWGQRTFDLNKDGVANYGMFPDWLQELQTLAGRPILGDMFHGAEAYLEMWERAYGVPLAHCRPAAGTFGSGGVGALRLGASPQAALYGAGQPASRPGRSFRYCVTGGGTAATVFRSSGRASLIATTARHYAAGTHHVGQRLRSGGIHLSPAHRGGWRYVWGSRGGRITFVGVASRGSRAQIVNDVRAAGLS